MKKIIIAAVAATATLATGAAYAQGWAYSDGYGYSSHRDHRDWRGAERGYYAPQGYYQERQRSGAFYAAPVYGDRSVVYGGYGYAPGSRSMGNGPGAYIFPNANINDSQDYSGR